MALGTAPCFTTSIVGHSKPLAGGVGAASKAGPKEVVLSVRGEAPSTLASGCQAGGAAFAASVVAAVASGSKRKSRSVLRHAGSTTTSVATSSTSTAEKAVQDVAQELSDIAVAGGDIGTPHWSDAPMKKPARQRRLDQMRWKDAHGVACMLSGIVFLFELVRFVLGQPPSDLECYSAAAIYITIYASRFESIRSLPSHFRVTFYATTGWTIYYVAHLLAATTPEYFAHGVYPAGIVFLASTIYFYKHWIERMWRHYVQDRFRPYYVPGLLGLMYFHGLDTIDLFNQWVDPKYWLHRVMVLPDQVWTIQDVRLTGLFMSSMALFMITLHNKGVLTGGRNTLITVLFTIFVPAFFLTGTHATLQASFP